MGVNKELLGYPSIIHHPELDHLILAAGNVVVYQELDLLLARINPYYCYANLYDQPVTMFDCFGYHQGLGFLRIEDPKR